MIYKKQDRPMCGCGNTQVLECKVDDLFSLD
jgi:hypothetical protein